MTEVRGQTTEVFEFGIGNAEFGKKKEDRGQKKWLIQLIG